MILTNALIGAASCARPDPVGQAGPAHGAVHLLRRRPPGDRRLVGLRRHQARRRDLLRGAGRPAGRRPRVRVANVDPGVMDTDMQARLRGQPPATSTSPSGGRFLGAAPARRAGPAGPGRPPDHRHLPGGDRPHFLVQLTPLTPARPGPAHPSPARPRRHPSPPSPGSPTQPGPPLQDLGSIPDMAPKPAVDRGSFLEGALST